MLISGQLKAGDRLPPENELSDQLGLSRSSLREAVKALELIRVLDVRRGDGTYVTSLEPELLAETMGFMVEIHQESSAAELLEVRRILEPGAAAHAATRIDARSVTALRGCLNAVLPGDSAAELAAHDAAFHSLIARASGNPYLGGLLDSLTGSALRLRAWQRVTEAGAVASVLHEHAAILEAMTLGDAELARSLMTVHIASAERWLRRAPGEAGTAAPARAAAGRAVPPTAAAAAISTATAAAAAGPQQTPAARNRKRRSPVPSPAVADLPAPTARQKQRSSQDLSRISHEPALYELFAMPSAPAQKAARTPRRPA